MLDKCLAALKKCQSEEDVRKALTDYELTDEKLDGLWGGNESIFSGDNAVTMKGFTSLGTGDDSIYTIK